MRRLRVSKHSHQAMMVTIPFVFAMSLDVFIPIGHAMWAFYVVSLLGVTMLFGRGAIWLAAGLAWLFTILGWVVSPACCAPNAGHLNRVLGLMVIAGCTWMLLQIHKELEAARQDATQAREDLRRTLDRDAKMQRAIISLADHPQEMKATMAIFREITHLEHGAERIRQVYER